MTHRLRTSAESNRFTGNVSTAVDGLHRVKHRDARRQFLLLRAPVDKSLFPASQVLEPGRLYKIPFTLVVPDRVSWGCEHHTANEHVKQSHGMLPPSLGSTDMAPAGCEISYLVRATILRNSSKETKVRKEIASMKKRVRIIPIVEEEPPIHVSHHGKMYRDQTDTTVKMGPLHLGKKMGCLTMTSSQPAPIQLRSQDGKCEAANSSAMMHLRFDPVGHEQPPQLQTVSSHLKVSTVFATIDMHDYPSTVPQLVYFPGARDIEITTVGLSKQTVSSTQWVKHVTDVESLSSSTTWAADNGPMAFYTAEIEVPVALPQGKKAFVPSFHSCLISRIYSLELSISYQSVSGRGWSATGDLSVPIQLTTMNESKECMSPSLGDSDNLDLDTKKLMEHATRSSSPPLPPYTCRED